MPSKAEKLLERMRQSKAGWQRKDFDTLYQGFGFKIRNGRSHDVVSHPDYPELRETLPRHAQELGKVYARNAVRLIDTLQQLQAASEEEENDEQ